MRGAGCAATAQRQGGLTVPADEVLLVGGQKVPSLGRLAGFPLPRRELVDEKVARGDKLVRRDAAGLFELGVAQDGREVVTDGPKSSLSDFGVVSRVNGLTPDAK